MELKLMETKEQTVGENHYTRDIYTIGVYTIYVDVSTYSNGATCRNVEISRPWNRDRNDFTPDIYYRGSYPNEGVSRFEIQTTSYGTLDAENFKKFLDAQQTALEIVKILNAVLA